MVAVGECEYTEKPPWGRGQCIKRLEGAFAYISYERDRTKKAELRRIH